MIIRTIHKLILIILITLSVSVFAEDKINWTGPYLGINAGYANIKTEGQNQNFSQYTFNNSQNFGLLGGFIGYQKALTNNWLIGIESDFQAANGNKTVRCLEYGSPITAYDCTDNSKIESTFSLRPKLGYILNNNRTLIYTTGGYALANIKTTYALPPGSSDSSSQWYSGWTLGAGIEHFLNEKISIKTEYRYADYGSNFDAKAANVFNGPYKNKLQDENSFRAGIAYHF
jgi:outer membrane immunogenic protein